MSNIIELIRGDAHTCFQSNNIKWVHTFKLIVDEVPTPVDYCNSGFTLHNNKLYCKSLGDLVQFVYSCNELGSLVEGKYLPPEVMYLLFREDLRKYDKYSAVYRTDEQGITWSMEWDEEIKDHLLVVHDQERLDFLVSQFEEEVEEIKTAIAYWKKLSDPSWFTEETSH